MKLLKSMKILAIDTSCDDTCVAIIEVKNKRFKILGNVVSSQVKIHRKYGGVFPSLAKREHQKNLVIVLQKALKEAKLFIKIRCVKGDKKFSIFPARCGIPLRRDNFQFSNKSKIQNLKFKTLKGFLKREEVLYEKLKGFLEKYGKPKVDAIAVTIGPGLEPCLWVGVNFAKALALAWDLPFIPVNHIEAHILSNFLALHATSYTLQDLLPAICLVVSGGHTQLILMEKIGHYKIIGETRDDAAGECFDKTARILGLKYPGGPIIAAKAAKFSIINSQFSIKLPRPMIKSNDFDFSFSGLKTAVLYDFEKRSSETKKSKNYISEMAKEIQQSIADVLVGKTIKAAKKFKAKSVILGGGVAANKKLREKFGSEIKNLKPEVAFLAPPKNLCTDNAAMIGVAAFFSQKKIKTDFQKIHANANLKL